MKLVTILSATLLSIGFSAAAIAAPAPKAAPLPAELATNQKIIIKKNWKQASRVAKEKKLPVMIRFSDEVMCQPCQKWHKTVFDTPQVKNNAGAFCVVLDFELAMSNPSRECREFKDKYSVKGFPTVLMVDADGKLLTSNGTSCQSPESLLGWMKKNAGK